MNLPLISAFIAIFFTQFIKFPIAFLLKKPGAQIDIITSTGGMPSSHSAAVSALVTALALEYGFSSPHVATATIFGVIVLFDSMGVRRQSGEQGIVLDKLARDHIDELEGSAQPMEGSNELINPQVEQYVIERYEEMIINKYLGHKPSEVIVGVLTGGTVAIVIRALYYQFFLS